MEWISAKDRLPNGFEEVMIAYKDTDGRLKFFHRDMMWDDEHSRWIMRCPEGDYPWNYEVTHWMSFPELPKD